MDRATLRAPPVPVRPAKGSNMQDPTARFTKFVDHDGPVIRPELSPCWVWTGATHEDYGTIWWFGASQFAHRVSWTLANGDIPAGLVVCHRCDNPPCVNPEHLFLGTRGDNNRDRDAKGRHALAKRTHCKNGHEFTEENTTTANDHSRRVCRACSRERTSRYRMRRAA